MRIIFYPPSSFTEKGMLMTNQDYILPQNPLQTDKIFVLCDGMGGLANGEVASKITAECVYHYIEQQPHSGEEFPDFEYFNEAILFAYQQLVDYLEELQSVAKMGTTLAMLYVHEKGVCLLHLGDSRIYQIRNGRILYKSKDHRVVEELIEQGIISSREAQQHPWRNTLSRALVANIDTNTRDEWQQSPTVFQTTDVQSDDYFFLCSDGVFENLTEYTLIGILQKKIAEAEKLQEILEICEQVTYDNYSGFLLKVQKVEI